MKFKKELVGGSTDLLVLSLIDKKDMYGFEIIKELKEKSNDSFNLKEGTLYPVLHKLENKGYLKSYSKEGNAGRKRKYYEITSLGKKQLESEKEEWSEFFTAINTMVFGEAYGLS